MVSSRRSLFSKMFLRSASRCSSTGAPPPMPTTCRGWRRASPTALGPRRPRRSTWPPTSAAPGTRRPRRRRRPMPTPCSVPSTVACGSSRNCPRAGARKAPPAGTTGSRWTWASRRAWHARNWRSPTTARRLPRPRATRSRCRSTTNGATWPRRRRPSRSATASRRSRGPRWRPGACACAWSTRPAVPRAWSNCDCTDRPGRRSGLFSAGSRRPRSPCRAGGRVRRDPWA